MNAHPELVLELRKSGSSIQDYYNKWIEHGEDESVWNLNKDQHQTRKKNYGDMFNQIVKYTENIDINKVQGQMKQFNKVLETVQLLLNDFIGNKNISVDNENQKELFNFFRD